MLSPLNRSPLSRIRPAAFRLVEAGLLAFYLIGIPAVRAQSSLHGGIEIGAKGIKAIVIEVTPGKEGPNVTILYSRDANTSLAALKKDGTFQSFAIEMTGEEVGKFHQLMEKDLKVPAENISIIASSGLPNPPNFADLKKIIREKTGKGLPPPIDANTEVALSIKHAVKLERRDSSILVDVGSGNTKGGYLDKAAARGVPRGASFSIPLGSVTFMSLVTGTKEGRDHFAETAAKLRENAVTTPLANAVAKDPEFTKRKTIYLLGGVTWAMVTLLKPEAISDSYVPISANDIETFHKLLMADPGAFPSAGLHKIKDGKDRVQAEKDLQRVRKNFTPESLLAGCEILRSLSNVLQFKEKQVLFPRFGYLAWIRSYVEDKSAPLAAESSKPGYWGHPYISKRGDDEKSVAEKLANSIVTYARTSVKGAAMESFEKKVLKEGRAEYHIKAGYKGAVVGTKYTANIVIFLDTSEKYNWEVLRIDYSDNNKLTHNRKKLATLLPKLNGE